MKLRISSDLSLPLDFVTQTQAILAKRRAGKSYTASVQAEELLKADQQIVVIDPTGAWWGLKSSADGKHAGFPIAIFGGERADVPLEVAAGEVIANAIVEQRFSAILDLSLFRKGEINRFMAPFLETLYRKNREAMHLFVDEADAIAPQKPFGEEARMLGAMEDVVRRGGIRGIGCTLITQRPAVLNKNVLTQCEILCALHIVHHRDIDAIREWVSVHGDEKLAEKMIESLPSLPIGTAWFWSPGWGDIFKMVKIRQRETFDSGATPKAGQVVRKPKAMAKVDIVKLGALVAETVQRTKENDPKLLKARIAELERQVKKPLQGPVNKSLQVPTKVVMDQKAIERAVREHDAEWRKFFKGVQRALQPGIEQVSKILVQYGEQLGKAVAQLNMPPPALPKSMPNVIPSPAAVVHQGRVVRRPLAADVIPKTFFLNEQHELTGKPGPLPEGERLVLRAAAQYNGVERKRITILTGYKKSTRDAYILRLRTKGFVVDNGKITPTQEGLAALGDFEPLPTGEELQRYWIENLPEGEKKIFEYMLSNYRANPVERDALNEVGFAKSSRDAYLQRMRARGVVEPVGRGEVKLSSELFE